MRVALYARVSTLNGQNPETQLVELREYASRRGWEVIGEYVDAGVSGSKDSRPSLNRLMSHAHQRKFDAICVWKLDRFGRSLKHLVTALGELEALGVTFVSLKDNWDLSTPSGRLMFQIVGAMAEFEKELIRERIRAGMRRRKLEGYVLGRSPLAIDHEALVADRLAGMSLTKVAKKYGVSRSSVVRFTKQALKRGGFTNRRTGPNSDRPATGWLRELIPRDDSIKRWETSLPSAFTTTVGGNCT